MTRCRREHLYDQVYSVHLYDNVQSIHLYDIVNFSDVMYWVHLYYDPQYTFIT